MKHEYLTFLHVMLTGPYLKLAKPFDTMPPEQLVPLAECLGNRIADQYQELVPRVGPLQPMMCQKSEDGRAYLCVRRTPDNGILCYMCCAAEASSETPENKWNVCFESLIFPVNYKLQKHQWHIKLFNELFISFFLIFSFDLCLGSPTSRQLFISISCWEQQYNISLGKPFAFPFQFTTYYNISLVFLVIPFCRFRRQN